MFFNYNSLKRTKVTEMLTMTFFCLYPQIQICLRERARQRRNVFVATLFWQDGRWQRKLGPRHCHTLNKHNTNMTLDLTQPTHKKLKSFDYTQIYLVILCKIGIALYKDPCNRFNKYITKKCKSYKAK